MAIPINGSCEAEYEDGYIHNETNLGDVSPYDSTKNILNDILEKRPEPEHGKMVRFSVFWKDHRYDINWTDLPDNARPIRFKHMEATMVGGTLTSVLAVSLDFGYQYNDEHGNNFQERKMLS